jgi:hypothetical protein
MNLAGEAVPRKPGTASPFSGGGAAGARKISGERKKVIRLSGPITAATTPTRDAANVISILSDTYADVAVDTWRADFSMATLEEIMIQGNHTKKYTSLDFAGVISGLLEK